ncbi:YcnI family protein [Bosea lathyri]|jgi:uncharacterized protein YcnI|uniref:Uncharacterized protein YcnI n=1 Tax=Bosea lathyri TaxID=1036778 RepID=A0A1H6AP15_9HYPH|nr:YcnI family protein [Bosea lathyri]SEG50448.1 Uncharacterized protein YcnI [Bosea lathyri]
MTGIAFSSALAAVLLALASPAMAHATLETQQAPVGATYKGVMRVGHGCDGAATLKLRIRIPEAVIAVKPMPKPGWTLDVVKGAYDTPYDYYGTAMSEGVREIVWTGKLPDEHYDEFTFRAYLTGGLQPETTLYFPTVQECEGGKFHRWIEIPASGKSADSYEQPAPGVKLLPAKLRTH